MYVKLHRTKDSSILAICDDELIGKKFKEKELKLDVTERFYKGEKMSEEKILAFIKKEEPYSMNLIGKETIKFAIRSGLVDEENVLKIKGIPHALIF